jgi:hypothetical protein
MLSKLALAFGWLKTRKAAIGWVVAFLAGGFQAVGLTDLSYPLGLLAAWLHGAGKAASDAEAKARQ